MAFDYHHLYITDNNNCLWAIDRQTGSTMWKQASLSERYITGPAVVNNMVVVGDRGGYIHFIAPNTGHLLNRVHVAGKLYQNPLGMGNEVLVSAHNGKIAAVHCERAAHS
jgi:outer membrane protein assembly factor BamB